MPKFPIDIFLPAAGLGERLRPVTRHLPKPLLPILGKPVIECILENLSAVCDGRIGINLHYKPQMIRAWASGSRWAERITFFPEDPILGTGGALKNASGFLSSGDFIVHNADILIDIDFSRLIKEHISSGNIATLVCHRLPHLANVVIDRDGQVIDVENPGDSRPDPSRIAEKVAYTGIAVYSPDILKFIPTGVSHATTAWIAASQAGFKVRAMDFTGCYWNDVGNPITYARGVLDALRREGEAVYISGHAVRGGIETDGYVVVEEGSEVRNGSRIRNCIIMPGATVSGLHENQIIGPDYEVALSESDMQPSLHAAEKKRVLLSDPLLAQPFGAETTDRRGQANKIGGGSEEIWSDAILIGLGGSERRYFRVWKNGGTAVLMECRRDDPDYDRHLVYTEFFAAHTVPVPRLISVDSKTKRALFEDLGDTSLYSYVKLPLRSGGVEDIYCKVLDILVKLHTRVTEHVTECPMLMSRIFDYDYLRWETEYFIVKFVVMLRKQDVKERQAVEREFHLLALQVDGLPKTVIHRDFQCQNIMIKEGTPRVIDYQGARMAPPAYDIASILWDPYHRLDDSVRERLLDYYIGRMRRYSKGFSEKTFLAGLLPCRLQRHMQALGAYGFLSLEKGKRYFLKHVPEALRVLKDEMESVKSQYPALYKLIQGLA